VLKKKLNLLSSCENSIKICIRSYLFLQVNLLSQIESILGPKMTHLVFDPVLYCSVSWAIKKVAAAKHFISQDLDSWAVAWILTCLPSASSSMIQALRSSCSRLLHVLLSSGLLTEICWPRRTWILIRKKKKTRRIWINAECLSEDGAEQLWVLHSESKCSCGLHLL